MKIKSTLLIPLLLILLLLGLYFLFDHSSSANEFVFSNFINPFNPLEGNKSEPVLVSNLSERKWKDPRGQFPIIAYNLPEKTKDLTASLKVIEKGGINIIINGNLGWMPSPYKVKEAFEKLGETNLSLLAIIEN